jgi:hypothetical protein
VNAVTLNAADEPGRDDEEERRQALGQIADALGRLGHPASAAAEIAELRRSVDSLRDRIERGSDRGCHHYGSCCHGYFHYYPYTYTSVAAGGYAPSTYTVSTVGNSTVTYPVTATTTTAYNPTTTLGYIGNTYGAGGGGGTSQFGS